MGTGSSPTSSRSRTGESTAGRDPHTALDRLRADGLIEVDREEIVDNRLRRYYQLTSTGAERLADEAARLHANALSRCHDWS